MPNTHPDPATVATATALHMRATYALPTPIFASKATIEQYCEQFAQKFALTDFQNADDPLVSLTTKLGGSIHYVDPEHLLESEDGSIVVHGPTSFDVYISNFTGPIRNRFTLAHELGHYFLHSGQGKTPLKASRRGSNQAEWEANWFAAALLMPASEVRSRWANGIICDAASLAANFRVSVQAADYRINALGLKT